MELKYIVCSGVPQFCVHPVEQTCSLANNGLQKERVGCQCARIRILQK